MKSPKNFREDVDFPLVHRSDDGKHENYASRNVETKETRDWINVLLLQATAGEFSNPYPVWQRVEKILATYGIVMPRAYFPDVTGGEMIFGILPHGTLHDYNKSMPTELGDDVPNYFLYFEYGLSESGTYVCFAEICDLDGLDSLTEDVDEDDDLLDEARLLQTHSNGDKNETKIDHDLEDHHERLVTGISGGKGFQRVFENKEHQEKELGKMGDVRVHSIQRIHEEIEQLDELSNKKLGQYIGKAVDDVSHHSYESGGLEPDGKSFGLTRLQHDQKSFKRQGGIERAAKKIATRKENLKSEGIWSDTVTGKRGYYRGDKVSFNHYGSIVRGVVAKDSRHGAPVHIKVGADSDKDVKIIGHHLVQKEERENLQELSWDTHHEYTKKAYKSRETATHDIRTEPLLKTGLKGEKTWKKRNRGLSLVHKRSKGFFGEK